MYQNKINTEISKDYITYNQTKNINPNYNNDIDLKSIAEWIACGFFLGDKNFTKVEHWQENDFSYNLKWFYEPRNISFNRAVEEFAYIFETLISKNL